MTRPRDRLGRPLPWGTADEEPPVPAAVAESDRAAWIAAVEYLDRDLPFHAHEACELRWRAAPEGARESWRGLAQWGAALTHRARGNDTGARRLAQRALATLAAAPAHPDEVDLARVEESCRALIDATGGHDAQ